MSKEIEMQPLERFCLDGGTQARLKIEDDIVMEYAEAMQHGDTFPPVIVFDDGNSLWLADGFHRYQACKFLGKPAIATDRREGSQRDAILYSLGANASHGLRRSSADKRRAVEMMLKDSQWSQWSGREIAKQCGVDEKTVRNMRDELHAENPQNENSGRTFIHHKTGKPTQMKTAKIGENKGDSAHSLAKVAIALPVDAVQGAASIIDMMGRSYAESLIVSLQTQLETTRNRSDDENVTAAGEGGTDDFATLPAAGC
jgi:hypothetical protein